MENNNRKNLFIYLSEFLRRPIWNENGEKVGGLYDIILKVPDNYPEVVGYIANRKGDSTLYVIDSPALKILEDFKIICRHCEPVPFRNYNMEGRIRANMDLVGQKIVDTRGKKVVRICDLHLLNADGVLKVAHIDISLAGSLRMYFGSRFIKLLSLGGLISVFEKEDLVSWRFLNAIPFKNGGSRLQFAFKSNEIMEMHPAEIADIIEELDRYEQEALFKSLDKNKAAETLSELDDTDVQKSLLAAVGRERAADLLEEMPPDEAADLLQDIDEREAKDLISEMDKDDARVVEELIKHEEDTAGGLMTTEFVTLPEDITSEEAIDFLRNNAKEAETIYYIYIVDKNSRLKGTVSLKRLIVSEKKTPVSEIMAKNPVYVYLQDDIAKISRVVSKYNLLAIPVVDRERRVKGVITLDDLFEVVIEDGWKRKLGDAQ